MENFSLIFLVFVLFGQCVWAAKGQTKRKQIDEYVYKQPLSSLKSIETFFNLDDSINFGWAKIFACSIGSVSGMDKEHACKYGTITHQIFQRIGVQHISTPKTVFFQIDNEACFVFHDTVTKKFLKENNVRFVWFGMRLIPGPNSKIDLKLDKKLLKRIANGGLWESLPVLVLMFDEELLSPTNRYNEKQLSTMVDSVKGTDIDYIALELNMACNTPRDLLRTYLKGQKLLVYDSHKQRLTSPLQIQMLYRDLTLLSTHRVVFLISRKMKDRIYSALPNIDWAQSPSMVQLSIPNVPTYRLYIEDIQRPCALFNIIRNRQGLQLLNEKDETFAETKIEVARAYQAISPRRKIVFQYKAPLDIQKHIDNEPELTGYIFERTMPYYIIRSVVGPNADSNVPVPNTNTLHLHKKALYFVGFVERLGTVTEYNSVHYATMRAVLASPTFRQREMGVTFHAKHMCTSYANFTELKRGAPNLKYAIIYAEKDLNLTTQQMHILQSNIRRLDLETISFLSFDINSQLYYDKEAEVIGPDGSTVQPDILTTQSTSTTPGVSTHSIAITFPIKAEGGAETMSRVSWVLLTGVLGFLCAIF